MSDTPIEVVVVEAVEAHPHADRLEIVTVLGTKFISGKGDLRPGESCVYFPPDMLIDPDVAVALEVDTYLKHAQYKDQLIKTKCRIGAIRLRGIPSFGFGIPIAKLPTPYWVSSVGPNDVTAVFGGVKYQPPVHESLRGGNLASCPEEFHRYTSIQHFYRNARYLKPGTRVRITEKLHGTNSRVGLINTGDEAVFMWGSHRTRKSSDGSVYALPLTTDMRDMLQFISCCNEHNVIVFGEIYGAGVQAMDYGTGMGRGYRVFDISVNGEYLDWGDVFTFCELFDIDTVPVLYTGTFTYELIDRFIDGPTTMADTDDIRCKFKGREGIVITPLIEQPAGGRRGTRLILKAVSADYYEAMK
jgi:RNA ligase (TIGR02306 family)